MNKGQITQVMGPVVDVLFEGDYLPPVSYTHLAEAGMEQHPKK